VALCRSTYKDASRKERSSAGVCADSLLFEPSSLVLSRSLLEKPKAPKEHGNSFGFDQATAKQRVVAYHSMQKADNANPAKRELHECASEIVPHLNDSSLSSANSTRCRMGRGS
jgi:hypothetical protein